MKANSDLSITYRRIVGVSGTEAIFSLQLSQRVDKSIINRESRTKDRGIRNILSGNQEQMLGVSGTAPFRMSLIIRCDQAWFTPLTSLTDLINISNSRAFLIPRCKSDWKLKPFEGFRFPRKGNPSLTSPVKHGGGEVSVISILSRPSGRISNLGSSICDRFY
jgi:hypothetical protein